MAIASVCQSSFLGGEWSPQASGRIDDPNYAKAMTLCRNSIPIEEASWVRRSGTRELGPTFNMYDGIIREFGLPNDLPVYLELTYNSAANQSYLRFWCSPFNQAGPPDSSICLLGDSQDSIVAISNAVPAVVQTSSAHSGWVNGGTVCLYLGNPEANAPTVANRQFVITQIDTTHFALTDMLTGQAVNGATLGYVGNAADKIVHTLTLGLPYTSLADVKAVKICQANQVAFLTHQNYPTVELGLLTYPPASTLTFNVYTNIFQQQDGPYLDAPRGNSQTGNGLGTATVGTLTPTFIITDASYSFVSTDVGRAIRLWSMPPAYTSAATWAPGQWFTYQGVSFLCISGSITVATDPPPPNNPTKCVIGQDTAAWSYGYITTVNSSSNVTVQLLNQEVVQWDGASPQVIDTYQLGLYTAGQYPSCGSFHEGRVWLGGALPGRFDASCAGFSLMPPPLGNFISQSNEFPALFSPTNIFGDVTDAHAISYSFQGSEVERVLWIEPDHNGLIFGTAGGEWLIQASNLNNILTPTSIQAHRVTRYKCADTQSVRTGLAIVFVQALKRRVMEYLSDAFTQRFSARHLNEMAKHLTQPGVRELGYQEELAPIVWGCCFDGSLFGCTYRRVSQFATEMPLFTGWHRHDLGSGRKVTSLTVGPNQQSTIDALALLTEDVFDHHFVEVMQPLFDAQQVMQEGWFLDSAVVPNGVGNATGLTFSGMGSLSGLTVGVTIAGLNCGSYNVSSSGQITVPYNSDPDKLLTQTFLLQQSGLYPQSAVLSLQGTPATVPVVIGQPYVSQGQLLRPQTDQQTRSPIGPAMGKPRRIAQYAIQFSNTVCGVGNIPDFQIGTDFAHLRPIVLTQLNSVPLLQNNPFTGIWWDTLDSDTDFDNMICWQISSPYNVNVIAITSFLETNERA